MGSTYSTVFIDTGLPETIVRPKASRPGAVVGNDDAELMLCQTSASLKTDLIGSLSRPSVFTLPSDLYTAAHVPA